MSRTTRPLTMRWMSSRWVRESAGGATTPATRAPAPSPDTSRSRAASPKPYRAPTRSRRPAPGGRVQEDAPVREEANVDPGVGQRQLGHDANDGRLLRGGALQELGPRRRVEEQVPHLDGRAGRSRRPGPDSSTTPPSPTIEESARRSRRPRQERQPRDGEDRGQRLPAEPERADRVEVGLGPELRGRMPLQREQAVLGRHPAPVVRHRDELAPGAPHRRSRCGSRPRPGCSRPAP